MFISKWIIYNDIFLREILAKHKLDLVYFIILILRDISKGDDIVNINELIHNTLVKNIY